MQRVDLINARIKKCRCLAGYTQETAAQALGMKPSTYARLERLGEPKLRELKRMAEVFRVPLDYLINGDEDLKPNKDIKLEDPLNTTLYLHSDSFVPIVRSKEPDLLLTVNEKNVIKACRKLSGDKRSELVDIINQFVKDYAEPDD